MTDTPISDEAANNGTAELPIGCPEWCAKMIEARTLVLERLREAEAVLRNAADAIDALKGRYHTHSEMYEEAEEMIGEIAAFLNRNASARNGGGE